MKCRACDCLLSDLESTIKDKNGKYTDMCFFCMDDVNDGEPNVRGTEERLPDETGAGATTGDEPSDDPADWG